ncbi:MAG: protein kinase [Proteobacteria bacterium]|nr:protein kinase [Pseudomonadota bacterium]
MATGEATRKFHFIREIASGGFGSVYLAKVIHGDGFSRLVAIKLLHQKWTENDDVSSRMRDEARLLGWLRHKNIVDVIDLTLIDGRCAVIMEYLEAVDMKIVVNASKYYKKVIPLRVCLEVTAAVASALDAAYNRPPYAGEKPLRVIHRDIKPSNIMVDDAGTVKVLDFGVARAEFDEREAETQELSFGSVDYMPPERLFFEPDTAASDVYSLGVALYEMLALEKFGKAKLRQDEQDHHIRARLDHLFEVHPMPSEAIEDEVYELLDDMMAFDESDRILAADCANRMRALAREMRMEGLDEWSEKFIPPLVEAASSLQPKEKNPLVDRVLSEDSRGFARNDDTDELTTTGSFEIEDYKIPEDVDETELDQTGRKDDARWSAIKQATLDELSHEGSLEPVKPRVVSSVPAPSVAETSSSARPQQKRKRPRPVVSTTKPKRSSGSVLMLVALLAGFIFVLGAVLTILVAALGWKFTVGSRPDTPVEIVEPDIPTDSPVAKPSNAPTDKPADTPPEIPADTPAPPEKPASLEPSTRFVSKLENTKKITVRCDNGKGDGTTEVEIIATELGDCAVTAINNKRKRIAAVVKKVAPREYICFEDDKKSCE